MRGVSSGDSCIIPPNYALMSLKTEWCGTLHCAPAFAELPNVTYPKKSAYFETKLRLKLNKIEITGEQMLNIESYQAGYKFI